jgi:HEAT repeat protein
MQIFYDPELEQSLIGISRLLKAVSYYPDAHPAVNKAVHEATEQLKTCLASCTDGTLALEIRRQGFVKDGAWLNPDNKILAQLALQFFMRKIKTLVIFADVREQHLLSLAHCLALDAQQLENRGGAAQLLERAQVSSIVLNQIDLNAIGSNRSPIPSTSPLQEQSRAPGQQHSRQNTGAGAYSDPSERLKHSRPMVQMLQEAQHLFDLGTREQVPAFQNCLDSIRQRLDALLATPQHHAEAFQALTALDRWIHDKTRPSEYSAASTQCLRQLDPGKTVAALLDTACKDERQRNLTLRLIQLVDADACKTVWEQLIIEPNPRVRRFLTGVMSALGAEADRVMLEYLNDSRWYVVRNALNILGTRRNPEYISAFKAQLFHRDTRVVKESIAALATIRHEHATDALLDYIRSPDCALAELALLALGAHQDPRAVPDLIRIAQQHDPLLKQKKVRVKAIEALGEIRSPEANSTLVDIIRKGKIIKRGEYRELRLAAISALGRSATREERDLLQRLSTSHDPQIAKRARHALQSGEKE